MGGICAQEVEATIEQLACLLKKRGVTREEYYEIWDRISTALLYQLQERRGTFYEEAKHMIEDNAAPLGQPR
jgi:hypothetical protein